MWKVQRKRTAYCSYACTLQHGPGWKSTWARWTIMAEGVCQYGTLSYKQEQTSLFLVVVVFFNQQGWLDSQNKRRSFPRSIPQKYSCSLDISQAVSGFFQLFAWRQYSPPLMDGPAQVSVHFTFAVPRSDSHHLCLHPGDILLLGAAFCASSCPSSGHFTSLYEFTQKKWKMHAARDNSCSLGVLPAARLYDSARLAWNLASCSLLHCEWILQTPQKDMQIFLLPSAGYPLAILLKACSSIRHAVDMHEKTIHSLREHAARSEEINSSAYVFARSAAFTWGDNYGWKSERVPHSISIRLEWVDKAFATHFRVQTKALWEPLVDTASIFFSSEESRLVIWALTYILLCADVLRIQRVWPFPQPCHQHQAGELFFQVHRGEKAERLDLLSHPWVFSPSAQQDAPAHARCLAAYDFTTLSNSSCHDDVLMNWNQNPYRIFFARSRKFQAKADRAMYDLFVDFVERWSLMHISESCIFFRGQSALGQKKSAWGTKGMSKSLAQ